MPFDNIINKAKSVAKQAADQTNKLAKVAKLKTNIMTLKSEKGAHLNTIGLRTYSHIVENGKLDGPILHEKIRDEVSQIERIEAKVKEIESEIAEIQASTQHVDVTDVTDDEDGDN